MFLSRRIVHVVSIVFVMMLAAGALFAQDPASADSAFYPNAARSEALQQATLNANDIIDLLSREPGLTLTVKRALIRIAYRQGRILKPEELTDDVLFDLIRHDERTREVVTYEIEDRSYVTVNPRREDVLRALQAQQGEQQTFQTGTMPGYTGPAMQQAAQPSTPYSPYYSPYNTCPAGTDPRLCAAPQRPAPAPRPQPQAPAATPGPQTWTPSFANYGRPSYQTIRPEDLPAVLAATSLQSSIDGSHSSLGGASSDNGNSPFSALAGGGSLSGGGNSSSLSALMGSMGAGGTGTSGMKMGIPGLGGLGAGGLGMGNGLGMGGVLGGGLGSGAGLGSMNPMLAGRTNPMMASLYSNSTPNTNPAPSAAPSVKPPSNQPADYQQPRIVPVPNPYANVPSLYDLYTQVSPNAPPQRFGADLLFSGTGNADHLPMDLPAGPDYVVGPGDGLNVDFWGSVSDRIDTVVDPEGRISLPEVGTVLVSGKTLGQVQQTVQTEMRREFRDIRADVSLARLHTVRIYVVGDVQRPGAYDVSSLSTVLNALFMAGGPTDGGSLRTVKQYRGKQLVQEVDVYDLLLHGIQGSLLPLQSGDTVLVPPMGPQVTVDGMVRRPAVYELHTETTLADVLSLAGGVLPSGTLRHITVDRLVAHQKHEMLSVDLSHGSDEAAVDKALADFKIQDGDSIRISPIQPYSAESIYLDGHVFHPGKFAYHQGMTVADLIKSYNDLLPEPYLRHAEIIRLEAPDYRPEVIGFNLGDVIAGRGQAPALKPLDTVRIFGRYDFEDSPTVAVTGEVRDPGDHLMNGATHLRDAIYLAGGLTPEAQLGDVEIYRRTNTTTEVLSVNLRKALAGDATDNLMLEPRDHIIIHANLAKIDPPMVTIEGEVANPGHYPLAAGMTATDLVKVAGGVKRSAYLDSADLARYDSKTGKVLTDEMPVEIGKAMAGDESADLGLQDGDVLTIRQMTGWKDIGAVVTVKGEVIHPGTYGIRDGERLSSVLERAGGFRANAYPYGAVLERVQVKELSEKSKDDLIKRIETTTTANVSAGDIASAKDQAAALALQQKMLVDKLKTQQTDGRLVIRISGNIKKWRNTASDIEMRTGDVLTIPRQPTFVMIAGQVYNPNAITYMPGKNAGWYLAQAGGPTEFADKKGIFVIRANGSVVGRHGTGMFSGDVSHTVLAPGDTIIVPEKIIGDSKLKAFGATAQILSGLAIAARVATSF